jgi:RNA polymerase sigma factor (sigma-70 family)
LKKRSIWTALNGAFFFADPLLPVCRGWRFIVSERVCSGADRSGHFFNLFTSLYKRYFPLVLEYIRVQNGTSRPDEQDIAQDIFLTIWHRRQWLLRIVPLEYYLFIMVKNRLINEHKKRVVRRGFWKLEEAKTFDPFGACYQDFDPRKTERWLHAAIDALPPQPRTAYMLRERQGSKVYEIAALMRTSQAGVSRKLQEAERNIKAYLSRQML